jgi:hypothetical protein
VADSAGADSAGLGAVGTAPAWRRLTVLVIAGLWGLAVLSWPGLPEGLGPAALGRGSSVLIAAASIDAGLVVLTLTVGMVALQLLSQFSWRLNRTIIDRSLIALIFAAVGSGVVWPLWVAAEPSRASTRCAFAAFGWSVLLIASAAWLAAQRIQPAWLVACASRRALRLVERPGLARGDRQESLAAAGASLAELVGSQWLPYPQFRRAAVTLVVVLAARCSAEGMLNEVTLDVRDLAAQARERNIGARADALIVALGGLGIAEAHRAEVHAAVRQALLGLATCLRASGSSDAASAALDALVDVVDARVELLLPEARIPELQLACNAKEKSAQSGAFFRNNAQSTTDTDRSQRWWPTVSIRPDGFGTVFRGPTQSVPEPLAQVIWRFASGDRIDLHDLAAALHALGASPKREPQPGSDEETFRHRTASGEAYDLFGDTASALMALLPAPFPDSTGWAGGWQGQGELDRDARRIAGLAAASYLRGQYPPSSAVEESLEEIASMIRREPVRLSGVPVDRTGWRDPPSAEDEGGPASATAASLGALMELAFQAGFDRRALLTGRRILAAATSSAQAGDVHGLRAHHNAIQAFTRDAVLHGPTGHTRAGRSRQRIVLAGLIAEIDQLLEHLENPRLKDSIGDIADFFTWRAHGSDVFELLALMWRAKLAAAGWPVDPPGASAPIGGPQGPVAVRLLPDYLRAEAEEAVSYGLGREDPIWAAAAIITLWAEAAGTGLRARLRSRPGHGGRMPRRPRSAMPPSL